MVFRYNTNEASLNLIQQLVSSIDKISFRQINLNRILLTQKINLLLFDLMIKNNHRTTYTMDLNSIVSILKEKKKKGLVILPRKKFEI
jgi:hypothetical protein